MKRAELFFSVLLVPLDFCLLLLAGWLAYKLRFQAFVTEIRPVLYDFSPSNYLWSVVFVAVIWLVIFALVGLYHRRATDPWWPEVGHIILACSVGLVAIIVTVFLRREFLSSRFIILAAWGFSIIFVILGRLSVRLLQRVLFRFGYGTHRVVVIGQNATADEVVAVIKRRPGLGYAVVGQLPAKPESLGELFDLVKAGSIDEILLIEPQGGAETRQLFFDFAEEHHRIFRYAPDILRSPVGKLTVDLDLSVPIVEVPETTLIGWGRVMKRLADIIGSLLGCIVLSPFMAAMAVIIRLDSPGPAIYKSFRLSRGRLFAFYKFRTMKIEYCLGEEYGGQAAEEFYRQLVATRNARRGPVPKIVNDPRWTRIGKWLRRFSLDELPQLYNVLKGDMSLVGPRPHYPDEVARYLKHHLKVLALKPGLTGLAQVHGRSDLDFEDEVRLDRYYIEHWSLWLDMRILLRTIVVVFERRYTI